MEGALHEIRGTITEKVYQKQNRTKDVLCYFKIERFLWFKFDFKL